MKKSIVIRVLSLLLAVLVISPTNFAFATDARDSCETPIEPLRYTEISSIKSSLNIDSSGKATCIGSARATSSGNTVEIKMYLRSGNTDVKDWLTSGTSSASMNKTWYVTSGKSYYVMVYAYIYDSNGNLLESSSTESNLVNF